MQDIGFYKLKRQQFKTSDSTKVQDKGDEACRKRRHMTCCKGYDQLTKDLRCKTMDIEFKDERESQ